MTTTAPGTAPAAGTGSQAQTSSGRGITVTNVKVTLDPSDGWPMVDLVATDTTSAAISFTFTVSFFDASGNLLGTAQGADLHIGAGQTKTEAAAGLDSGKGYSGVQAQVDIVVPAQG